MQALGQNGYTDQEVIDVLTFQSGARELTFRYDLLDKNNVYKSALSNVLTCSVANDYLADIKRTAKFTLLEDGSVNYLSDRIKPWARVAMPTDPRAYSTVTPNYARSTTGVMDQYDRQLQWFFEMNDAPGSTGCAESSWGRTASVGAGVTLGTAPIVDGSSYTFNGSTATSGVVTVASMGNTVVNQTSMTLALWLRTNTVTNQTIVHNTAGKYELSFLADGSVDFKLGSTLGTSLGAQFEVKCANPYGTNLRMIAISWQTGVTPTIYLNGQPQPTTVVGTPVLNDSLYFNSGDVQIGYGYTGAMDDFAFITHYLTAAQVLELYRAGVRTGPFGSKHYAEWPQGVFLLSSPSRASDDNSVVTRQVDAYDQLQVVSDDLVTARYTVAAGTNYVSAVTALLPAGVQTKATPTTSTLPVAKDYDPGTSKLAIINDLLSALNYESLSFDENGVAVIKPYVVPSQRTPGYTYADDQYGVILPAMTQTLDLFAIPNQWVAVVSEPDRSVLTATYTNSNPLSVTSTVSRGRTIVSYVTNLQCPDQATLNAAVKNLAVQASQIYETTNLDTAIMPIHETNDVLQLVYSKLGISDKYAETGWSFDCIDGATMKHSVRRQVQV